MTSQLDSLFGLQNREQGLNGAQWSPVVDISEDDKEYLIQAELPGVRKEDINVTLDDGVLTITGTRHFQKEEKNKKYHRIERTYGSFTRSFTLPDDANADSVNAQFKDGILRVHVAKDEAKRPKTIAVKVD